MAVIGRIRKHSWIAVVVVGVAIAGFIINDFARRGSSAPTNVGSIGGEKISYSEFDMKIKEFETNYMMQQQKGQLTNEEHFAIQDQTWNEIVQTKLLNKEFEKLGIEVTSAEMNDMFYGEFIHPTLAQYFTDKTTGQYNRDQIKQIINNREQLPEEGKIEWANLEKQTKLERLASKYNVLLMKSFYSPLAHAKYKLKINSQTADVRYIVNNFSEIADDKVKLTDEDYKKYYDLHKKRFKQENSRDIAFVTFPLVPSAKDLAEIEAGVRKTFEEFQQTTTEDMRAFVTSESDHAYDSTFHKIGSINPAIDSLIGNAAPGQFVHPVASNNQWVMAKVIKFENRPDSLRISLFPIALKTEKETRTKEKAKQLTDSLFAILKADPSKFEAFVNQYSDNPTSKEKLGDLGWLLDGQLGTLNQKVINTAVGTCFIEEDPLGQAFFIVKVTGKSPEIRKAQVALITREIAPSETTRKEVLAQATRFAANTRNIEQMVENAKKEGLQKRDAEGTPAMSDRLPGINDAREIVRWSFQKETKKGDVAPKIFEASNMYIVAGVSEIREKGYATLEQVKPFIEGSVKIEKKAEILMDKAKKAVAETKDINLLATKMNTTVDTVTGVSFGEYSFGKNGPEMSVIGTIAACSSAKLLEPIKGYNGVYTVLVDKVTKAEMNVDPRMMNMEADMQNQQKLRMVLEVLKEKANVVDQRNFFY